MRIDKIKIGNYYRHKDHLTYCYAKVIKVLKAKQEENINNFTVVKCEWLTEKDSCFGLIKYFRPSNLVEEAK